MGRLASWLGTRRVVPVQRAETRAGAIDGLNLFFGALLGANLGTLDHIRLVEYVQLIVLLAGTVVTVRMVSSLTIEYLPRRDGPTAPTLP